MGCNGLVIAGGALQVGGFVLVAIDLYRLQQREFGTPALIRRLQDRLAGPIPESTPAELHLSPVRGTSSATLDLQTGTPPPPSVEERLTELEAKVRQAREEFEGHRERLERNLQQVRGELERVEDRWDRAVQESEQDRKTFLRPSVRLQAWGTGLFVVGTVLGVIGSVG